MRGRAKFSLTSLRLVAVAWADSLRLACAPGLGFSATCALAF
jgi:hypothetical protein